MALLDFERFGITADNVKSGKYSYIIGFDLGESKSTAAYLNLSNRFWLRPAYLKFDVNENRETCTAIAIDDADQIHLLTESSMASLEDSEHCNVFKNLGIKITENDVVYDSSLQKFFTCCFSRFVLLHPEYFNGNGLLLVNSAKAVDGDTCYDEKLSKIIKKSIEESKLNLDVVVVPNTFAILTDIRYIANDKSQNPIIIQINDLSSRVDYWALSDHGNTIISKTGPVGMNVLCNHIADTILSGVPISKSEIKFIDWEIRTILESLKSEPRSTHKIYVTSLDEQFDIRMKINYELIDQLGSKPTRIIGKSVKDLLKQMILEAFYEYCIATNIGKYDYSGNVYIVDSTESILTNWVSDICSKLIPNGKIVLHDDPSHIGSRGLCLLGAKLLS